MSARLEYETYHSLPVAKVGRDFQYINEKFKCFGTI
jgi:hypothetical protein